MNIDFINDDQSYTNKTSSTSSEIDEYDSSESIEYVNEFSDSNESSVKELFPVDHFSKIKSKKIKTFTFKVLYIFDSVS